MRCVLKGWKVKSRHEMLCEGENVSELCLIMISLMLLKHDVECMIKWSCH